jgi:hypothetical protein
MGDHYPPGEGRRSVRAITLCEFRQKEDADEGSASFSLLSGGGPGQSEMARRRRKTGQIRRVLPLIPDYARLRAKDNQLKLWKLSRRVISQARTRTPFSFRINGLVES